MYKTAFYSFYLPVALAMRMNGVTTQASYDAALHILLPLGEYFQVQDDYLDCYGAPALIGKIGTDILDNKCSWNINVALQKATPEQRQVLDASVTYHGLQRPSADLRSLFTRTATVAGTRFPRPKSKTFTLRSTSPISSTLMKQSLMSKLRG